MREITKVPDWAQTLAEQMYLDKSCTDEDLSLLEAWERKVRPMVLDKKLSEHYEDNFNEFTSDCVSCWEGGLNDPNAGTDNTCPYVQSKESGEQAIMDSLKGIETSCKYKHGDPRKEKEVGNGK